MELQNRDIKNIIKHCKKGDTQAMKTLYEMFSGKMMALCYRYLGNREDAQDVLMDSFLSAFEKIKYLRTDNVEGWIRRIMINNCLRLIKDSKRMVLQDDDKLNNEEKEEEIDNTQRFNKQELYSALQSLGNLQRTVFNLYVIEGYSLKEISEILEITYTNTKASLSLARKNLRVYLTNLEKERGHRNEN